MSIYLVTPIITEQGHDRRGCVIACDTYEEAVEIATKAIAEQRIWRGYEIVKRPANASQMKRSPEIKDFKVYQEDLGK